MAIPRLFLVAPVNHGADAILACAAAAAAAGDAASIVIHPEDVARVTQPLQALGLAVLVDRDTTLISSARCDGVHLDATEDKVSRARADLGANVIVGAYCGASRHIAMEAAEAGADYVALAQTAFAPGEPIIGWWSDLFEIPCVAIDPVDPADLDILLPQKPDFIRPSDAMWASPAEATRIIAGLTQRMKE
jgi:thiamine-phosphate pyrophosphorylase